MVNEAEFDIVEELEGLLPDAELAALRQRCESLYGFTRVMWGVVDKEESGDAFVPGWAVEAICWHLEAVANGNITRLLINVPPGFGKSLILNVFFPAWLWGPKNRPWARFISASYNTDLSIRDNLKFRAVISSELYQSLWRNVFSLAKDQKTKKKIDNEALGWKMVTSIKSATTGHRSHFFLIDDPNNPFEVESDPVRNKTNMWFTEVVPDRLNNLDRDAIIVIQQRTHEEDVSGVILARELGYVHLVIPMLWDGEPYVNYYDARLNVRSAFGSDADALEERAANGRAALPQALETLEAAKQAAFDAVDDPDVSETEATAAVEVAAAAKAEFERVEADAECIFWKDPRTKEGQLAWPERFSVARLAKTKHEKGDYA